MTGKNESGVVMVIGLVLLLLMTILGLAAVRGSGMQELMAGNYRDRQLAFQAAEAGLRQAEDQLSGQVLPAFDGSTAGYVQAFNDGARAQYWNTYNWATGSPTPTTSMANISAQPRFAVEEVGVVEASESGGAIDYASTLNSELNILYRVTSRAQGMTDGAVVLLQSTYKR
ncbi:pilus assembly protein [Simiduia curdlanivorans]|uniref:Pilus assembly protein n=1 Tax=Simiduia curdlanivorans TaxID=1492769 RepID=A0ABV8V8D3_9GAMM|nr:pilus assembly protein [Simiduia curdlanivorans]MDN3639511.1 pilus assembly protein [Simiduia curdlanivorans]